MTRPLAMSTLNTTTSTAGVGTSSQSSAQSTAVSSPSPHSHQTFSHFSGHGPKMVVTAPPWARDEPPSPTSSTSSHIPHPGFPQTSSAHSLTPNPARPSTSQRSHSHSSATSSTPGHHRTHTYSSSTAPDAPAPWWMFTRRGRLGFNAFNNGGSGPMEASSSRMPMPSGSGARYPGDEENADGECEGDGSLDRRPSTSTSMPGTRPTWPEIVSLERARSFLKDRSSRRHRATASTDTASHHHPTSIGSPISERDSELENGEGNEYDEEDITSQNQLRRQSTPQQSSRQGHQISAHQYQTPRNRRWNIHIPLPTPTFTSSHAKTPGWDVPWTPRIHPSGVMGGDGDDVDNPDPFGEGSSGRNKEEEVLEGTVWQRRRKRLRVFLLTNSLVPLLFRIINLALTTSALGIAIKIRVIEQRYHILGAVGSSPTLVIIFAPLTIVHVLYSIHAEYFTRPLGLKPTSTKLLHTLSETLFICAWSAALALSFDNFFTSAISCASPSAISWYNEIPRTVPPAIQNALTTGALTEGVEVGVCNRQLALICLVGVGLIMYCVNLVLSLFRIFEKVKYHPAAVSNA